MPRYEVVAELYWDGVQIRRKGDILTTEEPLKVAAKSAHYTPSLVLLPEEEKPHKKGKKDEADA